MHEQPRGRDRRRVLQIEWHRADVAVLDVDDPQLVHRLIEDVARIAAPARRVRALVGDPSRRTERLAGRRDRPDREHALVDRGHLGAVGRPRRPAAAARVDRHHRLRRRTTCRRSAASTTSSGSGWCLRGSAWSSARCRRSRGRLPSGDQAGAPGCGSVSCTLVTLPVATSMTDICATRHMPSTLKKAMRRAVGRPRRALRLRRQVGEAAAAAGLHVADPELQMLAVLVGRVGELRCRQATRPARCRAPASFVRFTGLPPTGIT